MKLTGGRVSIRPPGDGSFRVQGVYPWSPSSCVDPERPTLDGRYPGTLWIRTADDGTLTVTVTLQFQEYLEGIAEVPPTWPTAALEAQVIAARSYVLSRTGWTGEQGGNLDTPICGTADCQVYGGIPQPRPPGLRRWYDAVKDTRGQVLMYGDRPADTVYFSTSNGRTYGNDEVFGSSPLPYLRPIVERDDGASPVSRWRVELPFDDLATVLRAAGSWPRGASIASASVAGSTVRLVGGGESRTMDASSLRDAVNSWAPCLLPGRYPTDGLPVTIPSGWFGVSAGPRGLVAEGRGWGHGVGMVQWGAYGKASRGWPASRILAFYYGGLTPRRYPEPGTMQVVVATGLRSMTIKPSEPGATIGDRTLGTRKLRVTGGDHVTVSSA
ncbi:MAG: SpoIID/LytB domain-containing protein [Actinomycetota bacterium]